MLFLPFGLLIGALARMLVAGKVRSNWMTSILAGGSGALIGGWLGRSLLLYRGERPEGFAMSLLGALLLAGAYQAHCRWHQVTERGDGRDALIAPTRAPTISSDTSRDASGL